MSGNGRRFIEAGYTVLKPLIKVDGKPIIEYVVSMFPGDHEFIFICQEEHLANTEMKSILNRIKPDAEIIPVSPSKTAPRKKGPVAAVARAFDRIKDDEDVMVSYCDYYMEWDFEGFVKKIIDGNFDGAVPSYIGFHPHLLHKKYYAGVLADKNNIMTDIKEKHCFTDNLMDCYQSAGAYYFRRGSELKKYFQELMDADINLNGEYYASMVYCLYLRDGKKIYVPEVKKFMQWGTPEDLEEFEAWSRLFAKKFGKEKLKTDIPETREKNIIIPHDENSEEYKKSFKYWEDYIDKLN